MNTFTISEIKMKFLEEKTSLLNFSVFENIAFRTAYTGVTTASSFCFDERKTFLFYLPAANCLTFNK